MPSLRYALLRWVSIVLGVTNSAAAASRFVAPSATSSATRSSCGVSWSSVSGARRRHALAGRAQLRPCAVRPRRGVEPIEDVEGAAQGVARVGPAAVAAQSLAVAELGARAPNGDATLSCHRSARAKQASASCVGHQPPAAGDGPACASRRPALVGLRGEDSERLLRLVGRPARM